jgi:hypothetical protein
MVFNSSFPNLDGLKTLIHSSWTILWYHKCWVRQTTVLKKMEPFIYGDKKTQLRWNLLLPFLSNEPRKGKCGHRTPESVRESLPCFGIMKSKNFRRKCHLKTWTYAALNLCELQNHGLDVEHQSLEIRRSTTLVLLQCSIQVCPTY